jgi:hypothetical protein
MTLGLQHSLPPYIAIDRAVYQHRIRIWWSIYCCDTILGSELGHPASIQAGNISIEMPSMTGLNEHQKKDFADPDYVIAHIKLARVVGDAVASIYNRNQTEAFARSVKAVLRDLRVWLQDLPASLNLPHSDDAYLLPRQLASLHLRFNQVGATPFVPTILHLIRHRSQSFL